MQASIGSDLEPTSNNEVVMIIHQEEGYKAEKTQLLDI
jgi:hypothetical protein